MQEYFSSLVPSIYAMALQEILQQLPHLSWINERVFFLGYLYVKVLSNKLSSVVAKR